MKKRIIALLIALAMLLSLMPTVAEDWLDLDALMQDIELEEQQNGLSAKRFVESLALLPEKTALYTDEALEDLFGTLNKETIAYVIERKEGEVPKEDTLLVAVAVKGSLELLYCLAGETVALTPDEANAPGVGYQVPGTNVWLNEADIALAERPEQEEVPVDEIEVPDFVFDDLFDQTEVLDQDDKATVQIITDVADVITTVGEYVTVSVEASGVASYQWQWSADGTNWNNNTGSGYNKASMTFKMTAAFSGRKYRCKLTGEDGSIKYTRDAVVSLPLAITSSPADQMVKNGETVTLTVKAVGAKTYQWQYSTNGNTWNNNTSAGYNKATFSFKMAKAQNGRYYRCVVTGYDGETAETEPARIFNAMAILTQPESQSVAVGGTVQLSVEAVGVATYQWQWSSNGETWTNNTSYGYNKANFSFTISAAQNGRQYRCELTDADGNVIYTKPAFIYTGLGIVAHPQSQSVRVGEYVYLTVKAVGVESYQWQWTKDGGVTWNNNTGTGYNTAMIGFKMQSSFVGRQYRCKLTGADGTVLYTDPATLYTGIVIVTEPHNVVANVGDTITLSVEAMGVDTYQWPWSSNGETWTNNTGAGYNKAEFSFKMGAAQNGRQYRCELSDADGNVKYTKAVVLSTPVNITAQPESVVALAGETVTFTVVATGVQAYQWQWSADGETWKNNTSAGCKTATFSFKMGAAQSGRQYRCALTGYDDEVVYTEPATLLIGMQITTQPEAVQVWPVGDTVALSLKASGAKSYQWQYSTNGGDTWSNNGSTGNKTDTMTFKMTASLNGRQFRCKVTGYDDTVDYCNIVTIYVPVTITVDVSAVPVDIGDTVSLSVTAAGVKSYQWQYSTDDGATWRNNTSAGYNTNAFSFTMTAAMEGRMYRCELTGYDDEVTYTSAVTIVTVAASEFTYTKTSDGTGMVITGYLGNSTSVVVPARINNLPVKEIGAHAFEGNTTITSIDLPDSVLYIREAAFKNCTNLAQMN